MAPPGAALRRRPTNCCHQSGSARYENAPRPAHLPRISLTPSPVSIASSVVSFFYPGRNKWPQCLLARPPVVAISIYDESLPSLPLPLQYRESFLLLST